MPGRTGWIGGLGALEIKQRYALWIQYDGSLFQGFQRLSPRGAQAFCPTGNPRRWPRRQTIQEELEVKLSLLLREDIQVWGSGRTDAGVHATAQVIAFDTTSGLAPEAMMRNLNAVLPTGLCVTRWRAVEASFHPRFSAKRRTYHYYLWPDAPSGSAFWSHHCWLRPGSLNLESMRQAAIPLLGSHDFSAYTRKHEGHEARTRNLHQLHIHDRVVSTQLQSGPWRQLAPIICFEVCANAFLRRMVRQLVANLVKVGSGEWPPERPAEILISKDASLSAPPAPPHGLFLVEVEY